MSSHLRISRLRPRGFRRHPLVSPRGMIALVLVLAAIGVGLLGFRHRASGSGPPGSTARVLTAARDLAAGTALTRGDVRSATYVADDVPDGALRDRDQALGRRVASPVRRGEPLTDARLVGRGLAIGLPESGAVAIPLRLADPGVAALLRPGDRIDVVAAPDPAVLAAGAGPFGLGPVPDWPEWPGADALGSSPPADVAGPDQPAEVIGPKPRAGAIDPSSAAGAVGLGSFTGTGTDRHGRDPSTTRRASAGAAGQPGPVTRSCPRDEGARGHDLTQADGPVARSDAADGSASDPPAVAASTVVSDVAVLAVPPGSDAGTGDALIVVAVPAEDALNVAGVAALRPLTVVIRSP